MRRSIFLVSCVLTLCLQLAPVRADSEPTAFERALYQKARYQVLCRLNDEDFVSYCVTMNIGGDTLLKLHDAILSKQAELADRMNEGLSNESPQAMAINTTLKNLKTQYAVKISEARKGLEIESRIAEETLTALSQYQK